MNLRLVLFSGGGSFVAGTLAVLVGCSRELPEKPHPAASSFAAAASSSAPRAESEPIAHPSESEVRALVAQWSTAQSTSDFAAYEKLYATKFTGIKRAGAAVRQYSRAAWMADRKTMIAPGLVVEVSGLRVAPSPVGTRVEFEQHYRSPRYEDTGRKQLFVVSTPDGPRITREEMLTSTVSAHAAPGQSAPVHAAESAGVFLVRVDEFTPPLRGTRSLRPDWLVGYEAEAIVDQRTLGEAQKEWLEREFTVYDAKGQPCVRKVTHLAIRAVVNALLETKEERQGYLDPGDDTARSLGRTVFALGYDYLFGLFDAPCPGARWAMQGTSSRVFAVEAPSQGHLAATRTAFHKLPAYRQLQAPSEEYLRGAKPVPWDTYADRILFTEFHPEGFAPRAVLSVRSSSRCDEFNGMLSVVFDVSTPETPALRGIVEEGDNEVSIVGALDTDGDGELEYVSGPDGLTSDVLLLRRNKAGIYRRESLFVVPNTVCPC